MKTEFIIFSRKPLLRTAAEEGCGFYGGHESSNDAGGAAGIRPGEQGQLQRQTTERCRHSMLHQSVAYSCT